MIQAILGFAAIENLIGLGDMDRGVICIAIAFSLRENRHDRAKE
jgi:hypothetical protein